CNYHMSQRKRVEGYDISPEKMIEIGLSEKVDGFSYTYNEPTIFVEYAHDIGVLARKHELFNTFVTNGYMTEDTVNLLVDFLDAATVDIKGNAEPSFLKKYALVPDPQPIFDTLILLRDKKIFIEITDLVVPEIGDNLDFAKKLLKWIYDNLGPETPVHFLRFFPSYKLSYLEPTPIGILKKHYDLARDIGMKYVYMGNVPGSPTENTYCPSCGKLLIRRYGFDIIEWNLKNGRCKYCGEKINVVYEDDTSWKKKNRFAYFF
ncbi:MAG: prepilin peptidase, partial [Candidatus Njordarchaeota archaeon]